MEKIQLSELYFLLSYTLPNSSLRSFAKDIFNYPLFCRQNELKSLENLFGFHCQFKNYFFWENLSPIKCYSNLPNHLQTN